MKITKFLATTLVIGGVLIGSAQADTLIRGVSDRMDTVLTASSYDQNIYGYAYENAAGQVELYISSTKMPENGHCSKNVQIKLSPVIYDGNPWGNTEDSSRRDGYIDIRQDDITWVNYTYDVYVDYLGQKQSYETCTQGGRVLLSGDVVPEGLYKIDVQDPDTYATHNVMYIMFAQVDLEITQGADFLSLYGTSFSASMYYEQEVVSCTVEYRDVSTGETITEGNPYYYGYTYDDGSAYGSCSEYTDFGSVLFTDSEDPSNVTVSEVEIIMTTTFADDSTQESIGRISVN